MAACRTRELGFKNRVRSAAWLRCRCDPVSASRSAFAHRLPRASSGMAGIIARMSMVAAPACCRALARAGAGSRLGTKKVDQGPVELPASVGLRHAGHPAAAPARPACYSHGPLSGRTARPRRASVSATGPAWPSRGRARAGLRPGAPAPAAAGPPPPSQPGRRLPQPKPRRVSSRSRAMTAVASATRTLLPARCQPSAHSASLELLCIPVPCRVAMREGIAAFESD